MTAVLRDAGPGLTIVIVLALIAFTAAALWPHHDTPAPSSSDAPGTSTPAAGTPTPPGAGDRVPHRGANRPPGIRIHGDDIAHIHITRTCGCQETRDYIRGRITGQRCSDHDHFTQWAREVQ